MDIQTSMMPTMIPETESKFIQEDTHTQEIVRSYTLRRLNSSDVFLMVNILSRMGINEWIYCLQSPNVMNLIKELFKKKDESSLEGEGDQKELGKEDVEFLAGAGVIVEIVNKIFTYLPNCQKEIYQLLSNVSGYSMKEMEELDAEVFVNMLVDFVKKEEFEGFIKAALRLIK